MGQVIPKLHGNSEGNIMTIRIDEFLDKVLDEDHSIVIKRLSANDTGATEAHQA